MRIIEAAADLFLGGSCPGCGQPGWSVCHSCQAALLATPRLVQRPLSGLPPIYATAPYDGPVGHMVLVGKDKGVWRATRPVGEALARAIAHALVAHDLGGPLSLVPVPSSARAIRERGLDTTAQITSRAATILRERGVMVEMAPVLVKRPTARDQGGLTAAERRVNLAHAISATAAPPPGHIVLVDDVVTTGASLLASVEALARVGARPVACACATAAGWT